MLCVPTSIPEFRYGFIAGRFWQLLAPRGRRPQFQLTLPHPHLPHNIILSHPLNSSQCISHIASSRARETQLSHPSTASTDSNHWSHHKSKAHSLFLLKHHFSTMAKDGTSSNNNKRAREEDNAEVVVVGDDHPPSTLPEIQERIRQLIARIPSKEETARLSVDDIPAMERWCKTVRKITRDYNLSLNFVAIANYQVNLIWNIRTLLLTMISLTPPLTWFHCICYLSLSTSVGTRQVIHNFCTTLTISLMSPLTIKHLFIQITGQATLAKA